MRMVRWLLLVGLAGCSVITGASDLAVGDADDGAAAQGGDGGGTGEGVSGGRAPIAGGGGGGEDAGAQDATIDPPSSGITFVQVRARELNGFRGGKVPFEKPVQAGSAIIIAVEHDSTATVTITDDAKTSYVPVVGPADAYGTRSWIFAGFGVPAGVREVEVSLDGPSGEWCIVYIHEYRGLTAFDSGSSNSGTTKDTDGMRTTVTTTAPNELLFAWAFSSWSAAPGTGFTRRSDFYSNLTEDRIVGAPGTYEATATMTQGNSWKISAAAFR